MLGFFDGNEEGQSQGFRLQYVEVFNWGTFDRHIWRLKPNGENSLLTGGNGSGKTTLVDAVATLLVPPLKRFYNQSSGAEKRRERDEGSYTRGAYLTLQSESGLTANTRYLREDKEKAFSILIGVFFNAYSKEHVSLAQVRWFSNSGLNRAYFFAAAPLTIEEDFKPMDSSGMWKRRLKERTGAEEFDSFLKYSQRFSKFFGLKSDKALSLFSQTIGIKVLGDLNSFIRSNMLEESDTEQEFLELREHYEHLLRAYQSIEQAQKQLELLQPVVDGSDALRRLEKELQDISLLEESIPAFFAGRRNALYQRAIEDLEADLLRKENRIAAIRHSLQDLQERQTNLHVTLHSSKVYEQLQNLEKQIQYLQREAARRRNTAGRYREIADALQVKAEPTEKQFYKNLEAFQGQIEELEQESQKLRRDSTEFAIQLRSLEEAREKLDEQLQSLLKRRNRLPLEQVSIRQAMIQILEVPEEALPFAAELIKVKDTEREWTGPVEQVLRPLALSLLVEEELYERVLSYVHRAQLDGKISFFKVSESPMRFQLPDIPEDHLLSKVEVKRDHPVSLWLLERLYRDYNYTCANGYISLTHYQQGVNDKGLIKNLTHHQRDDKAERISEASHVLGWDNRSTVVLLQRRLKEVTEEIADLESAREQREQAERLLRTRQQTLSRLGQFTDFAEIDWKSTEEEIRQLEQDRDQIVKSSDQLKELQVQLEEVSGRIKRENSTLGSVLDQKGGLQTRLGDYREKREAAQVSLEAFSNKDYSAQFGDIEGMIVSNELTVRNISAEENRISRQVSQEKEGKSRQLEKVKIQVQLSMQKFINPSADVLEKHPSWTADTLDLRTDLSFLGEFERLYRKIKEEDLPQFKKRFKDWLNERLILDIANFKASLDNKEAAIQQSIATINRSLYDIDFSSRPVTYIQLDLQKTRDQAVREFKQMLRDAMPDVGKFAQGDEKEQEASFKRIRRIIKELSANEAWRRKVTDVRNWLEFAAIERFRADDRERQYYVDSQSLSGGEKAKLAYTILASAIAYQFGIRNDNHRRRSLRFVVIDEAFSKVDPDNALYAMELFKQLNLQLMVVTPLDKINVAEPFIHTVHYVLNRDKRTSEVYDFPIEVYHQRKADFRAAELPKSESE